VVRGSAQSTGRNSPGECLLSPSLGWPVHPICVRDQPEAGQAARELSTASHAKTAVTDRRRCYCAAVVPKEDGR